ncbi:hypothetical protein ABFS82_12G102600 [Erythranthe guttata]|uniref:CAAX prenyl protease 2/Lysostaphin resistance protein A-like domain-containing protein n=1 Tax=Erythranthe guttata TaxID=4155 RepID=A0A022QMB7_ERYGU|nr:PREDICTED: uncharacterized protein LOC105967714 [Erythranthe guttata]EYU28749.1 hypothetical protein MIMGU_mgv1a024984mg [Erythranthe guttata]|eukprot:XP_012847787.1 PREDICTED: uncharacterized protein LOC105967714 [Erythranthe guttata]
MAVTFNPAFSRSSASTLSLSPPRRLSSLIKTDFVKSQLRLFSPALKLRATTTSTRISQLRHFSPLIPALKLPVTITRTNSTTFCFTNSTPDESVEKDDELNWQVLKRWNVPWNWQRVSLTSLACVLSLHSTVLIGVVAVAYSGINIHELSPDGMAGIGFVGYGIVTAVVLAVLFSLTKSFSPITEDIYQYDLREPFDIKKGWLLWAGIGYVGAVAALVLTVAAMSFFNFNPRRGSDSLMILLPMIGSSTFSTACVVGMIGVLTPVLEETVFRGFLMVSLTKWLPTPLSVLLSAAVFALAHFTPGRFPQLFVGGIVFGFSYAQTRNLLTPITIHAFWNTGIVLLLTFLQLKGYDIKKMLQGR